MSHDFFKTNSNRFHYFQYLITNFLVLEKWQPSIQKLYVPNMTATLLIGAIYTAIVFIRAAKRAVQHTSMLTQSTVSQREC